MIKTVLEFLNEISLPKPDKNSYAANFLKLYENGSEATYVPVSYTPLDVYKRQGIQSHPTLYETAILADIPPEKGRSLSDLVSVKFSFHSSNYTHSIRSVKHYPKSHPNGITTLM